MVDITSIEVSQQSDHTLVSANISIDDFSGDAWYRLPSTVIVDDEAAADAFFVIGIMIAMGTGTKLTIDVPVSKKLLYNTRAIEGILLDWYPKRVQPLRFSASPRLQDQAAIQSSTLACFTGGVDSFDTLISNRDEVDALVYVHGYDVSLKNMTVRAATSQNLRKVAQSTDKEFIEIETNIRRFINKAGSWPALTHGAALASVGHLLSVRFGRMLVPSSHSYEDKYAWGSHALLDHLWSSYRLDVVHDGAEKSRNDKIQGLVNDADAQAHLRVCWQNTGKYNCGECSKCLRTMIALYLAGALDEFKTFDNEIPWDNLSALEVTSRRLRTVMIKNVEFARQRGRNDVADILMKKIDDFDQGPGKKAGPERGILSESERVLLKDLQKRVKRLEKMWPIRAWQRFSSAVHRRGRRK